jgi:hypothetical protein
MVRQRRTLRGLRGYQNLVEGRDSRGKGEAWQLPCFALTQLKENEGRYSGCWHTQNNYLGTMTEKMKSQAHPEKAPGILIDPEHPKVNLRAERTKPKG